MNLLAVWSESSSQFWTTQLINHMWQSTVASFIAWLLVLTMRDNRAHARYWVWMAASVKFLMPFSLLIAGGESLRRVTESPITGPAVSNVLGQMAQPFPQVQSWVPAGSESMPHPINLLRFVILVVWASGALVVALSWCLKWRKIHTTVRGARPEGFGIGVAVLSSRSLVEPGVFGVFHQVLLLPEGIGSRLTPAQFDAIFAHEICHVRRRDNLTFAIHLMVETLFWFHPLVWWIGTRLVQERELACDEAVLLSGSKPEVYAEGILNVCKFYVESPLACVSGVSGSDLKKRVVRIMTEKVGQKLTVSRRLLLSVAVFVAVALPIAIGLAHNAQLLAQSHSDEVSASLPRFEVATIKPTKEDDGMFLMRFSPDGVQIKGMPVQEILRMAFAVQEDRLLGVPGWAKSDRYDVDAKVDAADAPKLKDLSPAQRKAMLLPLLADRFNTKYHHETRELPVYALTIAKGGSKLKESNPADLAANQDQLGKTMMRMGNLESQGGTIATLIDTLSPQVGRTIIDKTGLTAKYNFTLKWTPDDGPAPMPGGLAGGLPRGDAGSTPDTGGPSLFTALQEQLGLKLEPQKGPVDVIVIDHIDPPSPN